jgi:acetyl esterase/lipase
LPTGVSQPLSLIVYIHGGGWFEGSKSTCPGATFAQTGYAMACVDYRLSSLAGGCPEALIFPAQIHDVKAAVRWLRQHASTYGLNPNRVGALGNSSGGHLAALWGVSAGVAALEGTNNLGASDEVQAVADWYGPVDVTQGPIIFTDNPCQVPLSELIARYGGEETPYFYWTLAWGAFLGGSLADPAVLARAAQASPVTYVDAGPPFLVIHGENDGMVPMSQSEMLVAALERAGVEVTFVRLPGLGHSFAGPPGSGQEVHPAFLEPTLEFFDRSLRSSLGVEGPQPK